MSDLIRFNEFLLGIDLVGLREKYRPIKLVELDMPKNVQALKCVYEQYWDNRNGWSDYEEFFGIYRNSIHEILEEWRKECGFSEETFYRGLPARIYRTWASLLTQIQGAYVAEDIYGKGKVEMGVSIDHSGKDLIIELGEGMRFPVQIKKESWRKEAVRRSGTGPKFIRVDYAVPAGEKYKKDGSVRKPYQDWQEKWGDKLEVLENGFIIFKREMFQRQNLLAGLIE